MNNSVYSNKSILENSFSSDSSRLKNKTETINKVYKNLNIDLNIAKFSQSKFSTSGYQAFIRKLSRMNLEKLKKRNKQYNTNNLFLSAFIEDNAKLNTKTNKRITSKAKNNNIFNNKVNKIANKLNNNIINKNKSVNNLNLFKINEEENFISEDIDKKSLRSFNSNTQLSINNNYNTTTYLNNIIKELKAIKIQNIDIQKCMINLINTVKSNRDSSINLNTSNSYTSNIYKSLSSNLNRNFNKNKTKYTKNNSLNVIKNIDSYKINKEENKNMNLIVNTNNLRKQNIDLINTINNYNIINKDSINNVDNDSIQLNSKKNKILRSVRKNKSVEFLKDLDKINLNL